jgi:two-component system KDP operon response regulator KdpE
MNATASTPPGRILIIDDEVQIRRFLRISLSSQGYQVLEAASGEQGLALAATATPDLIVLDLGLPDIDGKTVLEELRGWSQIPVIILSVRASEDEKVATLDAGASDYVTKPFGIREFLARVRGLLRGRASAEQSIRYDDGRLTIDLSRRRVTLAGQTIHLTRKEYEVLRTLAASAGRVVTQTQLLRDIWGPAHAHNTHYLRIIIGRLRQKLEDDPLAPYYIETEPGIGYRFRDSDR